MRLMARHCARAGVLAGVALSLAGCSNIERAGPNEASGTLIGSLAGALIGSQFGHGAGCLASVAAGATVGGLIGNQIGAGLDDEDRARAFAAQQRALDSAEAGAPVGWNNPHSGRHGTVVPGPAYQRNSVTCRQFTHTVYVDGRPQAERATACRDADGNWRAVS